MALSAVSGAITPETADKARRGATGRGNGRLARLLSGLSLSCLLIDLSPAMLALAPRPVVRADGSRLPVADASADALARALRL